jgi:hypothetical protein
MFTIEHKVNNQCLESETARHTHATQPVVLYVNRHIYYGTSVADSGCLFRIPEQRTRYYTLIYLVNCYELGQVIINEFIIMTSMKLVTAS